MSKTLVISKPILEVKPTLSVNLDNKSMSKTSLCSKPRKAVKPHQLVNLEKK